MASCEIWQWSAVETADAVKTGQVSAVEVITAHIARMHAANPASERVVIDLSDQALIAARAADAAQARGEPLGLLHGVPVTVKINVDVEGEANTNGVAAYTGNIALEDSAVVANLRAAGAIIIGLTNTPEFSMRAFTDNDLHGLTLNPWDAGVTCGGSSGGAGAAVAMGIGAIAHGNDIGGSLRWPAFCNGVVTIKPSFGRVPAYNASAVVERPLMAQLMSVQGPLCREVADVRLALQAMSRRDPRDPWQVPAPLVGPPLPHPIKVAVADVPGDMDVNPEISALIDQAASHLADAGYDICRVTTPDITAAWRLWIDLIGTEIHILQGQQMRGDGGSDFVQALEGLLKLANILDGESYMKAVARRTRVLREWLVFLETYPLILAPVSAMPTHPVDYDMRGDEALNAFFYNDYRFTSAFSLLGLPAAAIPVGFAGGHPAGVQLVASRYREDVCLDAAAAIEARVGVMAHQLWARR